DELIRIIEETGDLTWKAFPGELIEKSSESLIENKFVTIKKEPQIIGKKDKTLIQFDDIYLEVAHEGI
ncbi:MAG: hypothetical protein V1769_01740, partial [Thermoplasmatota archaeon]